MLRKTMIVLAMAAALTGGLTADALARGGGGVGHGGGGGHGGGFGGAHVGGGFGLPVAARDTGQRENQPIYLRQWFQKLMQPDNPDMSCYGAADA